MLYLILPLALLAISIRAQLTITQLKHLDEDSIWPDVHNDAKGRLVDGNDENEIDIKFNIWYNGSTPMAFAKQMSCEQLVKDNWGTDPLFKGIGGPFKFGTCRRNGALRSSSRFYCVAPGVLKWVKWTSADDTCENDITASTIVKWSKRSGDWDSEAVHKDDLNSFCGVGAPNPVSFTAHWIGACTPDTPHFTEYDGPFAEWVANSHNIKEETTDPKDSGPSSTPSTTPKEKPKEKAKPGRKPKWRKWKDWDSCSASCGTGTQRKERECSTGHVADCEKWLDSSHYIERSCSGPACQYLKWSGWGACDKNCLQVRTRECESKTRACPGDAEESQKCKDCKKKKPPKKPKDKCSKGKSCWKLVEQCKCSVIYSNCVAAKCGDFHPISERRQYQKCVKKKCQKNRTRCEKRKNCKPKAMKNAKCRKQCPDLDWP